MKMKRKLFLFAVVAVALFAACSNEENIVVEQTETDVVNVSFTTSLDQALKTRAVSGETDGTQASTLTVAVYNTSNQEIAAIRQVKANAFDTSLQATVDFQLVKGQTYNFVFWAQNPGATAGAVVFDPATGKVSVDYTKIKANDETLDAFTAHVNELKVTGPVAQSVTLKRPWAQLNYGTTAADVKGAHLANIEVTKSKVVVNNLYKTLNLLDGTVSDETAADVELVANDKPAGQTTLTVNVGDGNQEWGKLTVDGTDYAYVGLNYLLVGGEADTQSLIKADLELFDANGSVNTIAFSNIPVQRNYRTNIVGNLLTSNVDFSINIDPMYDGESTVSVWEGGIEEPATATAADDNIYITSAEELAWVAQEVANGNTFSGKTLLLTKSIDLNNKAWTPIGENIDATKKFMGTFDGQNNTISNLNVDLTATPKNQAAGLFGTINGTLKNLTINNATVKNLITDPTANGTAVAVGSMGYGGTIENVHVKTATVEGNRRVAGIVGYVQGKVLNCSVEDITLTAKPDNLGSGWDNGDKVGCIAGQTNAQSGDEISGNTVNNFTITGYRDMGGIIGAANVNLVSFTNNTATNGAILIDQTGMSATTPNAAAIVGRILAGTVDASNTSANVTISEKIANGITFTQNSNTYTLAAGADIATAINSGKSKGLSEFTINLAAGSYNMVSPTTGDPVTIKFNGQGASTELHMENVQLNAASCTLEFNQVKLMCDNAAEYKGIIHGTKEVYNDCYFTGVRHLYAVTTEFNNCHFTQDNYQYCVFVYGTEDCTFNNCDFTTVGKTAKVYHESSSVAQKVTFSGCTFTTDGSARQAAGKDWKTAIEIDGRAIDWTVNINNCTETGHYQGETVTTSTLFNVDSGSNNTKVFIDGVEQTKVW